MSLVLLPSPYCLHLNLGPSHPQVPSVSITALSFPVYFKT